MSFLTLLLLTYRAQMIVMTKYWIFLTGVLPISSTESEQETTQNMRATFWLIEPVILDLTFMFTLLLWTRPIPSPLCISLQNPSFPFAEKGTVEIFSSLNLPGDAQRLVSLLHPIPPSSLLFVSPRLHKGGGKQSDISAEEEDGMCSVWMCWCLCVAAVQLLIRN